MSSHQSTKPIRSIKVLSVAPVSAAIYFILGCFMVASAYVAALLAPGPITSFELNGPVNLAWPGVPDLWMLLAYPFLSALAGAIGTMILAWLYNILAKRVGPIQVNLGD